MAVSSDEIVLPGSNKRKHILITTLLFLCVVGIIAVLAKGLMLNPNKVASALIDRPALTFQASLIQGGEYIGKSGASDYISLDDFKGKPLVLNFWASWCVSCREEAHELEAFWRKYKDSGIVVVGVAIQDEKANAEQFAKAFGKTYILGLDLDGKASIDYGVYGVPETFLIDRQGIIRHKEAGPVTMQMLEKLKDRIL